MSWPIVPLRRVFRVLNGGTPTAENENWGGDVPWVTPVDLSKTDGVIRQTERTLTRAGAARGSQIVPADSLIVSARAPIGYVAQTEVPAAFNQGCKALVPAWAVDARYFRYQLSALTSELHARGQGSTFQELSADGLAETLVFAPPLREQRRVADFLDVELAKLGGLVSRRKTQARLLTERSDACISEALLPGILSKTPRSREWPWLPEVLRDRGLMRLGRVCRLQTGLTVDSGRDVRQGSLSLPYLRVANVQAGYLDLSGLAQIDVPEAVARRSTLRPGDVLMTEGGDLDKLGRGTVWSGEVPGCLHQNHVFALRPELTQLDSHYLAYMTRTLHGRCYFESTGVRTTNLASTNRSKILSFPIPLPDLATQRCLGAEIRRELQSVEALRESLTRQVRLLIERRDTLIATVVAGQIDVATARGA